MTNYARTAATLTLNGQWVGQWDSSVQVPLDTVVQGKNQLDVELQDQPKGNLTLEVWTKRGGQDVNLLRLNFDGKAKGTYSYSFVAR